MLQCRGGFLTGSKGSSGLRTSFIQPATVRLLPQIVVHMRSHFIVLLYTTLSQMTWSCCTWHIALRYMSFV
jgi:hypothetical protein